MYKRCETLDDILRGVIAKLLKLKSPIAPTRGRAVELIGVLLEITNPRARLSRTEKKGHVFSCLGELLWYLAKTNDLNFISYYVKRYKEESEDGHTIFGGYGPRMFNMRGNDQIGNVITLLKNNPSSRRAVVQLFDAADIAHKHKEIPCTCTLQFMIRNGRLHMLTYMRSNDAFVGLPHDVFAFTMLQEIIARTLSVELGTYRHAVGSLHLYDKDRKSAEQYLEEGWQEKVLMPPMPIGDPWGGIGKVLLAESAIRVGNVASIDPTLEDYWKDIVRLLEIFRHFKNGNKKEIADTKAKMSSGVFNSYIDQKKRTAKVGVENMVSGQLPLL